MLAVLQQFGSKSLITFPASVEHIYGTVAVADGDLTVKAFSRISDAFFEAY